MLNYKNILFGLGFLLVFLPASGSELADEQSVKFAHKIIANGMRLDLGLQLQAKDMVPKEKLPESLSCIRKEVQGHLSPLYVKELISTFTKAELNELVALMEGAAWSKSWAIQESRLMQAFGMSTNGAPVVMKLSEQEENVVKQFASSSLGTKFFAYVMADAQTSNPGRDLKRTEIKKTCISAYLS